jgi:hypothetical protein
MKNTKLTFTFCLLLSMLWALAAQAASTENTTPPAGAQYFCVTVVPDTKIFVAFTGKEMRIAPTAAGLASAPPVQAEKVTGRSDTDYNYQIAYFPETRLPFENLETAAGPMQVYASFQNYHYHAERKDLSVRDEYYVLINLSLQAKAKDGALWKYLRRYAIDTTNVSALEAIQPDTAPLHETKLYLPTRLAPRFATKV